MENLDPKDQELFEFGGIFNMQADDFKDPETSSGIGQDFYAPRLDLDTVKNKTYSARIRFVPNVFCGKERKDRIRKFSYYLPDPDNKNKFYYIDSPCNNPNAKDIITNAYMMFAFKQSRIYNAEAPVQILDACKVFKRSTYWYSLVQVMQDEQQPDAVGKIKIFRFGSAVHDKIDQMIKGDPAIGRASVIPYDPFRGKDFILKITEGVNEAGRPIANYDHSFFDDGIVAMSLDCGKTRIPMTQEGKIQIYNYLKENSPMLDQVEFKPLTAEEEDKLIRTVRYVINDDYWFNQVYHYTYGKSYQPAISAEGVIDLQQYANQPQPTPQPAVMRGGQSSPMQPTIAPASSGQAPTIQPTQTANKFRSLREEMKDEKPSIQQPDPQPTVQTDPQPQATQQPEPQQSPAPANPSLSEMSGDIEALMSGDISCIDDIQ